MARSSLRRSLLATFPTNQAGSWSCWRKTSISAWNVKGTEEKEGTQIDLLIIRNDNVVNLCEMKFSSAPYTISKEEEQRLRHRIESLKATLSPKQSIHLTMITTYGVAYGKHSGIVQKEVKMEDLFK